VSGSSPAKILVIEDDEDSGAMLRYVLELGGHEVRLAPDGSKGVATAATWEPAIVIADLGLPGEMSGYDVARQLRDGSAYLVALSGHSLDEDKARARTAGFDLHVTKPIDIDALEGIVARALAARDARQSGRRPPPADLRIDRSAD